MGSLHTRRASHGDFITNMTPCRMELLKMTPSKRKRQKWPGGKRAKRHVERPAEGIGGAHIPPVASAEGSYRRWRRRKGGGPWREAGDRHVRWRKALRRGHRRKVAASSAPASRRCQACCWLHAVQSSNLADRPAAALHALLGKSRGDARSLAVRCMRCCLHAESRSLAAAFSSVHDHRKLWD